MEKKEKKKEETNIKETLCYVFMVCTIYTSPGSLATL